MKNSKILLAISMILLSGCNLSKGLWSPKVYKESFKGYFIDEGNKRVVLIGENKVAYRGKENYHYSIDNSSIKEIFTIGKKRKLRLSLNYPRSKGTKVTTRSLGIGFDKKELSSKEVDYLYVNKFISAKNTSNIGYIYKDIILTKYPTSQEIAKNYNVESLDFIASITSKDYINIWEQDTPLQNTGKALITPFTLAADIVLLPVTIPWFIYTQVRSAKGDYYCQGEFCGYDKIPELQKKLK